MSRSCRMACCSTTRRAKRSASRRESGCSPSVHYQLAELEAKSAIVREPRRWRGIRIA
ncbi:hypothetical protein K4749_39165 [Streptomyces sp. TRM72054]|uniref:hypothetical protein n=1 Tax=Streptomyces sp. TRM72054 TaxID=2870562 RepID=UPI001C8C50C4|nr:hypothetical protein [Streptomyces sp. TRM72054]MBX9399406.1 hypothetical protein [Streptomyces sp. TRM72054]